MAYPTPPSEPITEIATDLTYTAPGDDWDGADTKVAPTTAIEQQGYVPGDPRPADVDNWLFNSFAKWLSYLSDFVDELKLQKVQGPASSTDNAVARFDSTSGKIVQNSGVQIDDSANIVYASPKVRSIVIPSSAFVPTSSADVVVRSTDGSYSQSATNSAHFLADVSAYLNDRCTITAYGVYVTKGAARAGGNKMAIKLWRNPYPSSAVQLGSGDVDNGSSGPELLDETLGTPHAVDRAANAYSLDVKVGHDAATYPDAIVYGFITVSEAGPGLGT